MARSRAYTICQGANIPIAKCISKEHAGSTCVLNYTRVQVPGVVEANVKTWQAREDEGIHRMYVGLHKQPVDSARPVVPSDFASVVRQKTGAVMDDSMSLQESRGGSPSKSRGGDSQIRTTTARSGPGPGL